MAFDKQLVYERWNTPCSDRGFSLFFVKLAHTKEGHLIFTVRDEENEYDFDFENFGPYQVADEAFLQAFQVDTSDVTQLQETKIRSATPIGNTSLISNSLWAKSFNEDLMFGIYFTEGLRHYHIFTADSCLDILAEVPPIISVTKRNRVD